MTRLPTICFLTGTLNAFAGAERMTAVIANALAQRGFKVHVLSLWDRESCFALHPGVHHQALFGRRPSFKSKYPATVLGIRRFIQRHNVQVLVEVDTMLSLFTVPATLGMKTRRIAWEHCHFNEDLGKPLRRVARQLAALTSHAVVVLTERDREAWKQTLAPPGRVRVIANPLAFPMPVPVPVPVPDADSRLLLAVGRLTHAKGFDILLRAWAIAAPRIPGWRLRIAGEGEERNALEALSASLAISESVDMPGATSSIEAEYRQAGAFCLSSRYEGFGLVLIEAMAFGLPVVSTACETGPKELLRHGTNALVVPPENAAALANAIVSLCIDDDLKRRLAAGGKLVAEKFDQNLILEKWTALLQGPDIR